MPDFFWHIRQRVSHVPRSFLWSVEPFPTSLVEQGFNTFHGLLDGKPNNYIQAKGILAISLS